MKATFIFNYHKKDSRGSNLKIEKFWPTYIYPFKNLPVREGWVVLFIAHYNLIVNGEYSKWEIFLKLTEQNQEYLTDFYYSEVDRIVDCLKSAGWEEYD